jgi:phosphoglycerol transferase MdoB-like AlkP superfamily enzyme
MTHTLSPKDFPWKRSRLGLAVFFFFSLLVVCTVLRVALFLKFRLPGPISVGTAGAVFLIGFRQDFLVALLTTLPLLFWNWIISDRQFSKLWHRIFFIAGFFLFWTAQVFLLFAEYYFFEEFRSRFNTVAVDYLLYPTEVFGNIRDSYPVSAVVMICAGFSLAWMIIALWHFRQMWFQPTSPAVRFLHLVVGAVFCVLVLKTVGLRGTHFSDDRTLNEIANNGAIAFVDAAWTHNLDYGAFYKTMPQDEAYQRARRMLSGPDSQFVESGFSIRRHVSGDPASPKLNVVILLEESLGSEFWGCLGRPATLTPEMDRLATEEGLLFTNIYASGNRTVRGFEGVLSSFPPLPGESIVKRNHSDNVESIARVLKRDGYNTIFFYGGRGLFDGMRAYALRNGWDRFIEQKDFAHPTFKTIWGVCDEDTYGRAIEEFRALDKTGKPFLGTIMSVSNHKPYTYPRGRIPEDPDKPNRSREKAVKYSDWCLGKFFRDAKKESFWTNTLFVVVADHGARVYGSQSIPIHSYEIPFVILGPAVVKAPARIPELGCSLDVSPTLLGLIGRPYDTLFFGRDLLKLQPDEGRAFLNHNRDIGMLAHDRLVVLGMKQSADFYSGNPKKVEMAPLDNPTAADWDIEKDAIAVYQVADDLYMHEWYRIDGPPVSRPPPPAPAVKPKEQKKKGGQIEIFMQKPAAAPPPTP